MPIIFEQVEHTYNRNSISAYHALKGVNLEIKPGSFSAIIGQTGSGKSTLIQHINALLLPHEGKVKVLEYTITKDEKPSVLKPLRQKAGLVFQFPEYQLFEETIEKDIIFGPMNFGVSKEEAIALAKEVIELVGLDQSYLQRSPFELSGGQKRRVAIAGILAMNPDILVLDEPTAGLDPQGTKEMMDLFQKIHQTGKTVVLVTHDMNHVLTYCDHVIVMNQGKVEKHDTVTKVFENQEYLESLGIDLPMITNLIIKLNKAGMNIDTSINNEEQLINALRGALHG